MNCIICSRTKLGEEGTISIIDAIDDVAEHAKTEMATKADLMALEGRLNERITTEVAKLEQKLSETKADITKWMFLFWIGQIAVMIVILRAFAK
ncbi:MAG: hypothetical protein HQL05_08195 [Nitrospirae bacterium]|nr:hypothetical protein [Nitrospirota bacterium]